MKIQVKFVEILIVYFLELYIVIIYSGTFGHTCWKEN